MSTIDVQMLKDAGLSDDIIQNALRQHRVAAADTEIKSISASEEMVAIKLLLETADNPYRLIMTRSGTEVSFKLALWEGKTISAGNGNGNGNGKPVVLAGVTYDNCAAACDAHGWDHNKDSAVRVLTREAKKEEVEFSFDVPDAPTEDAATDPPKQTAGKGKKVNK